MQALYLLALDPVSETLADRNSYGFRKGRSTHDAIEQCFTVLNKGKSPKWVLEGDIKGCFDHISHEWMEANIPLDKAILRKWLKAGVIEKGKLFATLEGTPQGGIISPTLANMVLDGLEERLSRSIRQKEKQRQHYLQPHDQSGPICRRFHHHRRHSRSSGTSKGSCARVPTGTWPIPV